MNGFSGLLTLAAACLLAGCFFKAFDDGDFLGKYEAALPDGGKETLELLEGGKCKQVIRLSNGAVYEAEGTWEVSPHDGWPYLTFKGIRSAVTGFNEISPDIAKPPFAVISKAVTPSLTGRPMINFTEDSYYRRVR